MAYEFIRVAQDEQTSRLTLARPKKRNALSLGLMEEMIEVLEATPEDARCVVIAGDGAAFSAGHDLAEMVGRDEQFYDRLFERCTVMMETIHRIPQPVIARVHGAAFAAGCQLVAACDLAVAGESATFATPGVKIGLFCSTPMVPVTRAIGRKRAMEMLLTGEPISARTAEEWGLVNRVVPDDDLDDAVGELIAKITSSSALVTGLGKQAFYSQLELDEHSAYDVTRVVMSSNARLEDAQEGIGAFVGKRTPTWRNR